MQQAQSLAGELLPPGPTGEYIRKIREIKGVAEGIRTMEFRAIGMKITDVYRLLKMMSDVTSAYVRTAHKAIQAMPEISDRVESSMRVVQFDFQRIDGRLQEGIRLAISNGQTQVNGPVVAANVSLMLLSVAHGYEALLFFESIRPAYLDLVPDSVMRFVVDIAELVASIASSVSKAFTEAVEAAKKSAGWTLAMLKWGAVAGGLYLLYGVLKPEEA
jgi:hypothetical protein